MGRPRVLVVDLGGDVGRRLLSDDARFDVLVQDSFEAATRSAREFEPDAVVVTRAGTVHEYRAPLNELSQRAKLLLLMSPAEERELALLLKSGVGGVLFTDDALRLADAVHDLLNGGAPMSAPAAQVVLRRARRSSSQMAAVRPGEPPPSSLLSARQREVLRCLARGYSYEQIGLALELSVNTVRSHVRIIYQRLGASTKVEAVVIGTEMGLLGREAGS